MVYVGLEIHDGKFHFTSFQFILFQFIPEQEFWVALFFALKNMCESNWESFLQGFVVKIPQIFETTPAEVFRQTTSK